jgi:hypothetical protein
VIEDRLCATRVPHDVGHVESEIAREHWDFGLCAACAACAYSRSGAGCACSSRGAGARSDWRDAGTDGTACLRGILSLPAQSDVIQRGVCLQVFAFETLGCPVNTGVSGPRRPRCAYFVRNSGATASFMDSESTDAHGWSYSNPDELFNAGERGGPGRRSGATSTSCRPRFERARSPGALSSVSSRPARASVCPGACDW